MLLGEAQLRHRAQLVAVLKLEYGERHAANDCRDERPGDSQLRRLPAHRLLHERQSGLVRERELLVLRCEHELITLIPSAGRNALGVLAKQRLLLQRALVIQAESAFLVADGQQRCIHRPLDERQDLTFVNTCISIHRRLGVHVGVPQPDDGRVLLQDGKLLALNVPLQLKALASAFKRDFCVRPALPIEDVDNLVRTTSSQEDALRVPCTDDLPLAMGLRLKREESLLQGTANE